MDGKRGLEKNIPVTMSGNKCTFILITSSRFVFTTLMKYFPPWCLLFFAAVLGAIYALTVIYGIVTTDVKALFLVSGCMSLMFSIIYGLGMQKLCSDSKIGGRCCPWPFWEVPCSPVCKVWAQIASGVSIFRYTSTWHVSLFLYPTLGYKESSV